MVDPDLIERCQRGEDAAFDELYKAYATRALRTAYLLVGRRDIAEDIMQEAFFQCFRDIHHLRNPKVFHVWFNRLLVRTSCRLAAKERKVTSENLNLSSFDELSDNKNTIEEVEEREIAGIIKGAVNRLSQPLRTALVLFYYNDMTIKEIAQTMGCFEGTVKSRLHNAKRKLEKDLGKEFMSDTLNKTTLQREGDWKSEIGKITG